jgi:hypothetical protein
MSTPPDKAPEPGRDGSAAATAGVPTCQWRPASNSLYAVPCHLPVDSGHPSLCILHDPDQNKGAERFAQALREKIEREEADPGIEVINLAGAVFAQEAGFRGRVFTKAVTFAEAQFNEQANFGDAQFHGEVFFAGARFGGTAGFWNVRFGGTVYFVGARFGVGASFYGAHFGGLAEFDDAQFGDWAFFGYAEFGGWAGFMNARFGGEASFQGAWFGGGAIFERAQFDGETTFVEAAFAKAVNFSRSGVKRSLNFQGRTFPPDDAGSEVAFTDLVPESARNLRLEDVDLSRVSFHNTDVSQVHFLGCAWARKSQPLLWPLPVPRPRQERLAIYDELALDQEKEKREDVRADFPLVAERYRQLRLNLETSRQEAEAGHFYVGQMEMRRQDPSYPRPYRWLLAAYRVLALYGESYLRPPFFYFVFGVAFALAYLWGGFQAGQTTVRYDPLTLDWAGAAPFFKDGMRAYVQALTAGGLLGTNFFGGQMGANLETTSWWVPAVRYLNMVLDTFFLGFFVIALRRHFHR